MFPEAHPSTPSIINLPLCPTTRASMQQPHLRPLLGHRARPALPRSRRPALPKVPRSAHQAVLLRCHLALDRSPRRHATQQAAPDDMGPASPHRAQRSRSIEAALSPASQAAPALALHEQARCPKHVMSRPSARQKRLHPCKPSAPHGMLHAASDRSSLRSRAMQTMTPSHQPAG